MMDCIWPGQRTTGKQRPYSDMVCGVDVHLNSCSQQGKACNYSSWHGWLVWPLRLHQHHCSSNAIILIVDSRQRTKFLSNQTQMPIKEYWYTDPYLDTIFSDTSATTFTQLQNGRICGQYIDLARRKSQWHGVQDIIHLAVFVYIDEFHKTNHKKENFLQESQASQKILVPRKLLCLELPIDRNTENQIDRISHLLHVIAP